MHLRLRRTIVTHLQKASVPVDQVHLVALSMVMSCHVVKYGRASYDLIKYLNASQLELGIGWTTDMVFISDVVA